MNKSVNLPNIFCWTKMGTEAGQPLESIITRKNAERELGNGLFFWGIGTSLGQKIWDFIDTNAQPFILFSPMKSNPKKIDIIPEKVVIWSSYIDRYGIKRALPNHTLITSRGSSHRIVKNHHYALVCKKNNSLKQENWPLVDWAKLRNYKGDSKIGYSQVTAIVEHDNQIKSSTLQYNILFSAELVEPYYVKLADPVEIPNHLLSIMNLLNCSKCMNTSQLYEKILKYINSLFNKIEPDSYSGIQSDGLFDINYSDFHCTCNESYFLSNIH